MGTVTKKTLQVPFVKFYKDDCYWLHVGPSLLSDCSKVPETWVCRGETLPAGGEVQRGQGHGEECEGIQGGEQGASPGQADHGPAEEDEERPNIGENCSNKLLQVCSWD